MKYEQIISERMKERQIENGRNQSGNLNNIESRPNEPLSIDKTSKRKELAKIANTSEGSIQRIIKKGSVALYFSRRAFCFCFV